MTPRIQLALAIHNHQPVGNFGWVFEEGFQKAYLPMVECLERHPTIRLALHYTGPLRDWLIENQPEFLPRVRALVERGQVEIMTGAYYEPILVALTDADKRGQIAKLTEAVREDFGCEPRGLWLAERVWEPHLPLILAESGIDYTIVDDAHFKAVGYHDEDLLGYYVTEEQGRTLKILATSKPLRYMIPWHSVEEVIAWLREQAEASDSVGGDAAYPRVAVMGDDGEKFGLWPGTHEHIWQKGWMERFFRAIEANFEWLTTATPGEVIRSLPPLGRIYLPALSYDEMGEWSLPVEAAAELPRLKKSLSAEGREDILRYLRGGMWRSFMVKYPEVNHLHKKALWVSRKVHAMPDGPLKLEALDHLWAGECNCGYWHGVFGGIYLFHIREADYRHLIEAENRADGVGSGQGAAFARIETADFDHDSLPDVVMTSDRQTLVFDPEEGGGLVEWDYRPAGYNLLNVLTRYREGHHRMLEEAAAIGAVQTPEMAANEDSPQSIHADAVRAREADLEKLLIYDRRRRATLVDHFFTDSATVEALYRAEDVEAGDYADTPYQAEIVSNAADHAFIALRRAGVVRNAGMEWPVEIEKIVSLKASEDSLSVSYRLTNKGSAPLSARFGVEAGWGLAGGNDEHTRLTIGEGSYSLGEIGQHAEVQEFDIVSNLWQIGVGCQTSPSADLWCFPLETVSYSEAGFERNYQGSVTVLIWPIQLAPGGEMRMSLLFKLRQLTS